jgi:hypothetical protein
MRLWHVVWLAISVAGCSFDTESLVRRSAHAAPSGGGVVGLYSDGGRARDAGGRAVDAASPSDSATDSPALHLDAGGGMTPDADVAPHDAPVVTGHAADAPIEDAGMRDASTAPPPSADAATPASDAASGAPNPVRMQTLQLVRAAQISGNDRAAVALLTQLVAQAKSGAELAQVLASLDTDGTCALYNRVNCLTTCGIVATRCSVCVADPGCLTELKHVCGVQGPNCR